MNSESTGSILLFKRIVNKLGRPYGINPFPRAFANPLAADNLNRFTIFDQIYKNNFWGSAQSRSGLGSELEFTNRYRMELSALIRERNIQSVFDAPCGDLHWMQEILKEHSIRYIGGDISQSLVDDVKKKLPQFDVRHFDICKDRFPEVEVWHCRDCLFHLPFADIRQALQNFLHSTIPYALFTTHRARFLHRNLDVTVGGFRFLDLERPPFNFPPAIRYLVDYRKGVDFPRFVALWPKEAIAQALKDWPTSGQF